MAFAQSLSLHVAAPSPRQRKNGKTNIFHLLGGGCGYTWAKKGFAIQSSFILVPYHMIATSYVILLSVLHILDFKLDAEKINSLARQTLYLTLIVFGQRTTYWDITQVILVA